MYSLDFNLSFTSVNYVVVSEEFNVVIYMEYLGYKDLLRYYDVTNPLHYHEIVKDHLTLTII